MIYMDDSDRLHGLAARVATVAAALHGFTYDPSNHPTELELYGFWDVLNAISEELNEMSGRDSPKTEAEETKEKCEGMAAKCR